MDIYLILANQLVIMEALALLRARPVDEQQGLLIQIEQTQQRLLSWEKPLGPVSLLSHQSRR